MITFAKYFSFYVWLALALWLLPGCVQHMDDAERAKIHLDRLYRVAHKVERSIRPEAEEINDAINTLGDVKQAQVR